MEEKETDKDPAAQRRMKTCVQPSRLVFLANAQGGHRYHNVWRRVALHIPGRGPLWERLLRTQGNPFFLPPWPSYHSPSFLPPPSYLSIFQTVVHLPPRAAVFISTLLTWPFTSDPIPTILIRTESHYGRPPVHAAPPLVHVCVCPSLLWWWRCVSETTDLTWAVSVGNAESICGSATRSAAESSLSGLKSVESMCGFVKWSCIPNNPTLVEKDEKRQVEKNGGF